ncbi:unnamed protein product, partial [Amoebophrya sp. A25]|eukprot:GSA25T00013998001.1
MIYPTNTYIPTTTTTTKTAMSVIWVPLQKPQNMVVFSVKDCRSCKPERHLLLNCA